jgi:hypothetical protein
MSSCKGHVPEKQREIQNNETSRAETLREEWEVKPRGQSLPENNEKLRLKAKIRTMVIRVASFVGVPFSEMGKLLPCGQDPSSVSQRSAPRIHVSHSRPFRIKP